MNQKFDIVRIKQSLPPLSEMLEKCGHSIRRSGGALFTCCPFHEEKTPSCRVDDETGKFHCFGCGAGGDAIDFWQRHRGITIQDALGELASMAGVIPGGYTPAPAARPVKPAAAASIAPMTGELLEQWQQATQRLADSPREIQRIAEWRGIDPACVEWAAKQGLIGTYVWWNLPREAFLVEMPDGAGGRLPVSIHIRLAPHSKGNPRKDGKASWNFNPKGCGSWPFIIGNPATARYIFLLEGQWDALALVSTMGWHRGPWPRIAVIGLRGSTSGNKALAHSFNPAATVFAIADADGAGAGWFENKGDIKTVDGKDLEVREDGILTKLHERVRAVHAFWPTTAKYDFNDLVKSGELNREIMLRYLQPLMPDPRQRTHGPTFAAWCRSHTGDPDPIGSAARFVQRDKDKPKGRRPLKVWDRHWRKIKVPEDLYADLCHAHALYRKELSSPAHTHEPDLLIAAP